MKNVAIGGVLLFLSFLFVPTFFVLGYVVRSLRYVLDGIEEPPEFDEWGDLFMDGLKTFAIGFVYSLVPTVLVLMTLFATGVSLGLSGPGEGNLAFGLVAVLAVLATVVVSLLLAYVLPAAIVAWVRTDSLGAAFSPATLQTVGTDESYAVAWLLAVVIGFLAQVVGGALTLTFVGAVLVPFVTFYGNVASAYAIGAGVADTPLVTDTRDSESATGQPAV